GLLEPDPPPEVVAAEADDRHLEVGAAEPAGRRRGRSSHPSRSVRAIAIRGGRRSPSRLPARIASSSSRENQRTSSSSRSCVDASPPAYSARKPSIRE